MEVWYPSVLHRGVLLTLAHSVCLQNLELNRNQLDMKVESFNRNLKMQASTRFLAASVTGDDGFSFFDALIIRFQIIGKQTCNNKQ